MRIWPFNYHGKYRLWLGKPDDRGRRYWEVAKWDGFKYYYVNLFATREKAIEWIHSQTKRPDNVEYF